MNKEIELTPQGGNYYRAMAFHWLVVVVFLLPVFLLLLVAVLNPFWFRSTMFEWIERRINQLSRWRNYRKYHIYLGCDPKIWHTLKGDLQ
jgi:hypothetical protein